MYLNNINSVNKNELTSFQSNHGWQRETNVSDAGNNLNEYILIFKNIF